ncbi:MAG: hypothetical protein DWQ06_16150 [Calditrichaeota bacterium]|nr:MAG: hypothetical protein DWQ06_16150 [Calditrichota bacterium]
MKIFKDKKNINHVNGLDSCLTSYDDLLSAFSIIKVILIITLSIELIDYLITKDKSYLSLEGQIPILISILILVLLIYWVVFPLFKKRVKKYYYLDNLNLIQDKIKLDTFSYKLLTSILIDLKTNKAITGNLYLGSSCFVFIRFNYNSSFKDTDFLTIQPISEISFRLEKTNLPSIIKWVAKKPIRKNLTIYTKSTSHTFRVPEPEETIKKLEAIKQELLSEANSENV